MALIFRNRHTMVLHGLLWDHPVTECMHIQWIPHYTFRHSLSAILLLLWLAMSLNLSIATFFKISDQMNMKNFWVDCMVKEWESSHINYLLTVTSLLLSEQPASLSCCSDKSFTFLNNQGTQEILQNYSNLQHQMTNICSSVSIYTLLETLNIFSMMICL